jgi:hypothetical protein
MHILVSKTNSHTLLMFNGNKNVEILSIRDPYYQYLR